MQNVILVDTFDLAIGTMEKMEAHQKGVLHRAFSVFVFNTQGEMLLQQRAQEKYHSAGLWTNTCCSHPQPGEEIVYAAQKRLTEEMGFSCELYVKDKFIYKVELENNLIEHELDYILTGTFSGNIFPDTTEVQDFKWISVEQVKKEIENKPELFTFWFKEILKNFRF
jgi:isopentenyl-diphosphate delta-isomerase